jgi:site-specific DNA-methyltransferase (adenine-specific)
MYKLLKGDCLELMKKMPSNKVDLTVTSPPYDNLRKYNGNANSWNFSKFQEIAKELYRITSDNGVVVWVVSDSTVKGSETGTSFKQALYFKEIGFDLYDTMIWRKPNPSVPTEGRYYNAFEYMFVLSKGKPKALNFICDKENKTYGSSYKSDTHMNPENRKQNNKSKTVGKYSRRHNVWDIAIGSNKTKHPAVFPESLANDHILTWSNEGDLIFDPFMGSGTTGKMAILNNRNFIGIELDDDYFEIAKERIENSDTNKVISK